ncbi:hypothetical protein [Lentzea sp. CC55]|uniref:hypothetical protein n=1 Tax=Lentzea sp. CC55 TaxID=2884909 RepID=UPI001F40B2BF|nr:hypothetical protein [Lentzea sp. CC55]MCG8924911.1 hypothetical protein [Lentzea sp. CC55]
MDVESDRPVLVAEELLVALDATSHHTFRWHRTPDRVRPVGSTRSSDLADDDSNFGPGVNAADNWNFSAAAVCLQEVAVVPVLGDWVGDHVNNCSNGTVIDHSGS